MKAQIAPRTEARFPHVAAGAGHYESFYIKASHPDGGQAVWIRHTVHQRPGGERSAALWVTLFDSRADGPVATKQTFPAADLDVPQGAYIRVGGALLEPGRATGTAAGDGIEASWELTFDAGDEAFRHLPYERLYRARVPRTKLLSPHPDSTFSGSFRLGEREVALDGWPGMIGHNWGAEHAERWIWIQAPRLDGVEGDYLDLAAGRIKLGPMTTPWVANGRLVLGGEQYRLGGLDRIYGTEVDEHPTSCEFTFPGRGVNVKGRVTGAAKDTVAWIYADPKGPEHNVLNCSIADIELKVERAGRPHARVGVAGAAVYELGLRDAEHGIPVQPFPDG